MSQCAISISQWEAAIRMTLKVRASNVQFENPL